MRIKKDGGKVFGAVLSAAERKSDGHGNQSSDRGSR